MPTTAFKYALGPLRVPCLLRPLRALSLPSFLWVYIIPAAFPFQALVHFPCRCKKLRKQTALAPSVGSSCRLLPLDRSVGGSWWPRFLNHSVGSFRWLLPLAPFVGGFWWFLMLVSSVVSSVGSFRCLLALVAPGGSLCWLSPLAPSFFICCFWWLVLLAPSAGSFAHSFRSLLWLFLAVPFVGLFV